MLIIDIILTVLTFKDLNQIGEWWSGFQEQPDSNS